MDLAQDRYGREFRATEAQKGIYYYCQLCGAAVDLRKGKKRIYFAHKRGEGSDACENYVSGYYNPDPNIQLKGAIARLFAKGILANLYLKKTGDIFELECRLGTWKGENLNDSLWIETSKGVKEFHYDSFNTKNRFLLTPRIPVVQFDLCDCQQSMRSVAVTIRDSLLSFNEKRNFFEARGNAFKFIKKDSRGNETIDISKEILCLSKKPLNEVPLRLEAKTIGRIPGEDYLWYVSSITFSEGYTWDNLNYWEKDKIEDFFGVEVVFDKEILKFHNPVPIYEDEFGVSHLIAKETFQFEKIRDVDFYINGKKPDVVYHESEYWTYEPDEDVSSYIFTSKNEDIHVFNVSGLSSDIVSNLTVSTEDDTLNPLIEEKYTGKKLEIKHWDRRILEHIKNNNEAVFSCIIKEGRLLVSAPKITEYLELDAFGRILWEVPSDSYEKDLNQLTVPETENDESMVVFPGFSKAKIQEIMKDGLKTIQNPFIYKDYWRG